MSACTTEYSARQVPGNCGGRFPRDVGAQLAVQLEAVARHQHGEAVVADGAGGENAVARPQAVFADDLLRQRRTGGVEDEPVELAVAHHLGVAGNDGGARFPAGLAHRGVNPREVRAREAFLDHQEGSPRARRFRP